MTSTETLPGMNNQPDFDPGYLQLLGDASVYDSVVMEQPFGYGYMPATNLSDAPELPCASLGTLANSTRED